MPASVQQLNTILTGDSTGLVAAFNAGAAGVKAFQDSLSKQMATEGIAGPQKLAGMFRDGAQAAEEMATAIRTGASNTEVWGGLINKIPIVGQFKQAGEAIRELITGEKAAVIEAEKLGQAAEAISDKYRQIAAAASLRGLRGEAREQRENDIGADAKITSLHKAQEDLDRKIGEIESHKTDLIGGGLTSKDNLTDAQNAELKRLQQDKKANDALILSAEKDRATRQAEIAKAGQRDFELFKRDSAQRIEEIEAHMQEVSLRRQGDAIGSAKMKIEQSFLQEKHALKNQADAAARPYEKSAAALAGQGDAKGAQAELAKGHAYREEAAKQVAALERQKNQTVGELEDVEAKKRADVAKATADEVVKINREAGDIASEHRQGQLRAAGQHYAADLEALRQHHVDKLAEIQKQAADAIEKDPAGKNAINMAAAQKHQAEELGYIADLGTKKKEQAEKQKDIADQIRKFQLEGTRDAGAGGDPKAQQAAAEAEIHEKALARQREIAKLLKDDNATLAQRLALMAALKGSVDQEQKDIARSRYGGPVSGGAAAEDAGYRTAFGQDRPAAPLAKIAENTDPKAQAQVLQDAMTAALKTIFPNGLTVAGSPAIAGWS